MKGFKVHEDTAFEPFAPTTGLKGVKSLKGVISGPENAHVPSKKHGKTGGKQQLKFGSKVGLFSAHSRVWKGFQTGGPQEAANVAGEVSVDKKKSKREEVAEIEHVHRSDIVWQPPSAFDGIDELATHLRSGYARGMAGSDGSTNFMFPSPELVVLPELNDSFRPGDDDNGMQFEISIELNGDEFDEEN
jgi:hypothetical protein